MVFQYRRVDAVLFPGNAGRPRNALHLGGCLQPATAATTATAAAATSGLAQGAHKEVGVAEGVLTLAVELLEVVAGPFALGLENGQSRRKGNVVGVGLNVDG